jgi:hypothetical protein
MNYVSVFLSSFNADCRDGLLRRQGGRRVVVRLFYMATGRLPYSESELDRDVLPR